VRACFDGPRASRPKHEPDAGEAGFGGSPFGMTRPTLRVSGRFSKPLTLLRPPKSLRTPDQRDRAPDRAASPLQLRVEANVRTTAGVAPGEHTIPFRFDTLSNFLNARHSRLMSSSDYVPLQRARKLAFHHEHSTLRPNAGHQPTPSANLFLQLRVQKGA
jgi:hypothetical protein